MRHEYDSNDEQNLQKDIPFVMENFCRSHPDNLCARFHKKQKDFTRTVSKRLRVQIQREMDALWLEVIDDARKIELC